MKRNEYFCIKKSCDKNSMNFSGAYNPITLRQVGDSLSPSNNVTNFHQENKKTFRMLIDFMHAIFISMAVRPILIHKI